MTDTALTPTTSTYFLCRQGLNTLELLLCKVRIKLLTDTGKPISKERVLLAGPDKKVRKAVTDADGIAEFKDLPAAPFSRCFIVLPDILESWNDRPDAKQLFLYPRTKQNKSVPPKKVAIEHKFEEPSDFLDFIQFFNKDSMDAFVGAGDSERPYRAKDRMKHCVYSRKNTAEDDGAPDTIYINSLTQLEKYRHYRDSFTGNGAVYCTAKYTSYTGDNKIGFHNKLRRWNWAQGAVCNEFANFFLSYWFNHNSAFNFYAVRLDFLRLMEILPSSFTNNDETQDLNMRGFSDHATPIECPTGMLAVNLNHRSGRQIRTIRLRRKPTDTVDDFNKDTNRFFNETLMSSLNTFDIYSVSDGAVTPTGNHVDHHGGVLMKSTFPDDPTAPENAASPDASLKKFSADGNMRKYFTYANVNYRYPANDAQKLQANNKHVALAGANLPAYKMAYTLDEIQERDYTDPGTRNYFHIRLWALKPLRPGGYAPGDTGGAYKPEVDFGNPSVISPNMHHSLPRFIHWVADAPTTTLYNNLTAFNTFMAIPS